MQKSGLTEEEVPLLGNCPKCGTPLWRMWGEGWDYDHAMCPSRGCDYDLELDTITGHDPDGTIYIMEREKND